jgi:hypothetical protein
VEAVAEFPRPARVKQLQAFLGLFNFYRRFILVAAKLVLPLTRALRGGPKGLTLLPWTLAMAVPFAVAWSVLSSLAVLAQPVAWAELSLVTDASTTHMRGNNSAAPPWAGLAASGFFLSPAKQG